MRFRDGDSRISGGIVLALLTCQCMYQGDEAERRGEAVEVVERKEVVERDSRYEEKKEEEKRGVAGSWYGSRSPAVASIISMGGLRATRSVAMRCAGALTDSQCRRVVASTAGDQPRVAVVVVMVDICRLTWWPAQRQSKRRGLRRRRECGGVGGVVWCVVKPEPDVSPLSSDGRSLGPRAGRRVSCCPLVLA